MRRPRLGFLGLGWIGLHRLTALAATDLAEIAALADVNAAALAQPLKIAPAARIAPAGDSLAALLEMDLDGLVIATPNAAHAEQARTALNEGLAVFCQKPLARTAAEVGRVLESARRADRLLAVDFSYRYVAGMPRVRDLIRSGELGEIYAVDLAFHNAYGPDKSWFYDLSQSGGGCVMDLGTHLIDLGLWCLDFPPVADVASLLYRKGRLLAKPIDEVEDYATAMIELGTGASLRLACSWNLPAGREAVIQAAFHGTRGGAMLANVDGSFYDFEVTRLCGTRREVMARPPDPWGGRALVAWARSLAISPRFRPSAEHLREVGTVIDRIYGR